MKKILIFGATSALAHATARQLISPDVEFILVGRNSTQLEINAKDLTTRGSNSKTYTYDFSELDHIEGLLEQIEKECGPPDWVCIFHGILGQQIVYQNDFNEYKKLIEVNLLSPVAILTRYANLFEKRGHGQIAVVSSVAGDRGRGSNYAYASSKAALSEFLSGLRARLTNRGVHVLTIKPGFIDTPMTKDFKKGLLWAQPETVARDIVHALHSRRDVLYTPWFWRIIMIIFNHVPERIFKRLKI